jgi:prepilin-type N-terminal cleavage/methylation domain-containing protein
MLKKTVGKRFFTLLEIIVTIVIISIASTAVGVKITHLVSKHRFESSCRRVIGKIAFAKQMALTNQCDVFLTVSQDKENVVLMIDFASNHLEKPFIKEMLPRLFAELRESKNDFKKNSFIINCFSSGYLSPKGNVRLFTRDGKEKLINLEEFSLKEAEL